MYDDNGEVIMEMRGKGKKQTFKPKLRPLAKGRKTRAAQLDEEPPMAGPSTKKTPAPRAGKKPAATQEEINFANQKYASLTNLTEQNDGDGPSAVFQAVIKQVEAAKQGLGGIVKKSKSRTTKTTKKAEPGTAKSTKRANGKKVVVAKEDSEDENQLPAADPKASSPQSYGSRSETDGLDDLNALGAQYPDISDDSGGAPVLPVTTTEGLALPSETARPILSSEVEGLAEVEILDAPGCLAAAVESDETGALDGVEFTRIDDAIDDVAAASERGKEDLNTDTLASTGLGESRSPVLGSRDDVTTPQATEFDPSQVVTPGGSAVTSPISQSGFEDDAPAPRATGFDPTQVRTPGGSPVISPTQPPRLEIDDGMALPPSSSDANAYPPPAPSEEDAPLLPLVTDDSTPATTSDYPVDLTSVLNTQQADVSSPAEDTIVADENLLPDAATTLESDSESIDSDSGLERKLSVALFGEEPPPLATATPPSSSPKRSSAEAEVSPPKRSRIDGFGITIPEESAWGPGHGEEA